jgi:hypothetical protein
MLLVERLPDGWETVLVLPDDEYTRTLHSLGGPAVANQPDVQGWSSEVVIRSIEANGWREGPDLLVIDGMWAPDERLLGELRRRWPSTKIAMIGGLEVNRPEVDLRIIPEPGFQPPEASEDESHGRIVGGGDYVILGRRGEPGEWKPPSRPPKLLVSAGNADPLDASSLFIAALERCRAKLRADLLLGGGFLHADRLRERIEKSPADLMLVENVHDPRPMMARADLALACYGATCLELAQMGVPTVALTLGASDQARAARVAELGFLELVGQVDQVEPEAVAASVDDLLGSPDTLRAMSESGRRHIDGRGAERVTAELRRLLEQ